jgi:predicted metallo-beta-lactamase superfamily hydrolase
MTKLQNKPDKLKEYTNNMRNIILICSYYGFTPSEQFIKKINPNFSKEQNESFESDKILLITRLNSNIKKSNNLKLK